MRRKLSEAEAMGISLGCLVAVGAAALLGSVRGEVSQANGSLVLVLVVLVAAWTGGPWAGGATGIAAAVSFDFFLTRPYLSLAIKSRDDVITTVLLVVTGIATGLLAVSSQRAKAAGEAGTEEVASLHRVATLTATGAASEDVVRAVEEEVAAVLHLSDCHFQTLAVDPARPELGQGGRIDAPYHFHGEGFALPADGISIPAARGDRTLGWLVCTPEDPERGISLDRRRTATALVDHLALALALAGSRGPAPT